MKKLNPLNWFKTTPKEFINKLKIKGVKDVIVKISRVNVRGAIGPYGENTFETEFSVVLVSKNYGQMKLYSEVSKSDFRKEPSNGKKTGVNARENVELKAKSIIKDLEGKGFNVTFK